LGTVGSQDAYLYLPPLAGLRVAFYLVLFWWNYDP